MMQSAVRSDAQLVEQCRNGQTEAFRELVVRYQGLVRGVSYSATGDHSLSEDVAQETFVEAWRGVKCLRDPSKLREWLCGIARNLSSKALRRVGREIPDPDAVTRALQEVQARSPTPTPLDKALDKETERLVWTALRGVPESSREALVMFYREGKATKHVAEALGISENAVQQRLSRGRQRLHGFATSMAWARGQRFGWEMNVYSPGEQSFVPRW